MERDLLSVVVPLLNEEANVAPLVDAVRAGLAGDEAEGAGIRDWELILVDDGSTDGTAAALAREAAADARVKPLYLARRYGQTMAMRAGFEHAGGEVVVSMDGDLQNDPADIPVLLAKLDEGYDLVAGYRVDRKDALLTRRVPSWVANALVGRLTGVPVRDNGCSLRAYRREVVERLPLYSDMHRFIPVMAAATSGARIAEVPVRHHPRRAGKSKYGLRRVVQVLADLVAVKVIRSFRERPLSLFGRAAAGALALALATGALALMAGLRFSPEIARALVLPGVSLSFLGLAVFLFLLGLVAEVAVERWNGRGGGAITSEGPRRRPRSG